MKTLLNKFLCIAVLASACAQAEVNTVTFAYQFGWSYTAFHAMEKQGLLEKHAKAAGIDLKGVYKNLGTPGVIRDAMLAGQVNYGAVGVPTLIILADKTNGDWKALGNIVSVPMNLNVTGGVKDLCAISGKIAVPTIKSSVQAVTLEMASKKFCRAPFKMDSNTVSMTHPDGMTALLTGQVAAHLTSPPFNDLEIEKGEGRVTTLFNSYSILGGPTSFILLVGNTNFAKENPKVQAVVVAAFEEATKWVDDNKAKAALMYVQEQKSKEDTKQVIEQMSVPTTIFNTTPNHIGTYAKFMKEIGSVKNDMDWKFLTFPNLHNRKGS